MMDDGVVFGFEFVEVVVAASCHIDRKRKDDDKDDISKCLLWCAAASKQSMQRSLVVCGMR